jgi:UDP-N-acetylmuramyl pentapeptide phosphotransferase/UDP-N-acetylglucosamine-1-phosphate transferase
MAYKFCFFIILYAFLEFVYFKIARYYKIIDHPNQRSSHDAQTIRGGGIIFPVAFFVCLFFGKYDNWLFFSIALACVSLISFLDDIITLNNKVRILVQFFSIGLMIAQTQMNQHWFVLFIVFIVITGMINAYNFMDGINGITVLYSLVAISTLFWTSTHISNLLPDIFFISIIAALVVFSYLNLRTKAYCFAGDVGSISIAFVICFLILLIIIQTKSLVWLLFLGIYGIDTVCTIIFRIIRKENIFKAHRSHFYQFMANELKIRHVIISLVYVIIQLVLNIITINGYVSNNYTLSLVSLFTISIVYIIIRFRFEGNFRLFKAY